MKKKENQVIAIKRADGKIFKVGDKVTYKNAGRSLVKGKVSRRKDRISGFEKHENGWYVLYMPQYCTGKIEKKDPWRMCDISSAIKL